MVGKDAGKAKPLKAPKKGPKEYDEDELAFLQKKKEVRFKHAFGHMQHPVPS